MNVCQEELWPSSYFKLTISFNNNYKATDRISSSMPDQINFSLFVEFSNYGLSLSIIDRWSIKVKR